MSSGNLIYPKSHNLLWGNLEAFFFFYQVIFALWPILDTGFYINIIIFFIRSNQSKDLKLDDLDQLQGKLLFL